MLLTCECGTSCYHPKSLYAKMKTHTRKNDTRQLVERIKCNSKVHCPQSTSLSLSRSVICQRVFSLLLDKLTLVRLYMCDDEILDKKKEENIHLICKLEFNIPFCHSMFIHTCAFQHMAVFFSWCSLKFHIKTRPNHARSAAIASFVLLSLFWR